MSVLRGGGRVHSKAERLELLLLFKMHICEQEYVTCDLNGRYIANVLVGKSMGAVGGGAFSGCIMLGENITS